jgi:EmrB/QacA subfamily drug resistance transporter
MDARRPHYNLTFAILAIAGIAFALLQSLVAPALRTIQTDLHTTTTAVAWVFTGYLLAASVATPIVGRLGDMFGKKRMLVVTLAVVAAGTLVSALATSIGVLILGRVIQGAGGAIFPLAFAIIRDEFPRERIPTGIALISALLGVGGGLGIILAGPITEHLSYHWLFWLPLIAVVAAGIAAHVVIPESPIRAPGRIDWVGAGLLTGWLVALLVGVSEAPTWGWGSAQVLGLFGVAAVVLVLWVRFEDRVEGPLVDMRMMRLNAVWTTNLTAFLLGAGMYSSFILIPEFVELPSSGGVGFGASVTEGGLFLLPATLGMLFVGPLSGHLASSFGAKVPLVLGCFLTAFSYTWLAAEHGSPWDVYLSAALMGAGIGFAFGAMANLIVAAVRPDETGIATGMNTIVRTIGGALGSQISASVVAASTDHAFTIAFAISASAVLVSFLVSLIVPGRGRVGAPGLVRSEA